MTQQHKMVIVTSIVVVVFVSATIGAGVFDLYTTMKRRENISTVEEQEEFDRRIIFRNCVGFGGLGNPFLFTKRIETI